MPALTYKNLQQEVQDIDLKDGIVSAYWSASGNRDSDGDTIRRGAFAGTIAAKGPTGRNRIKLLWQHDPWEPIGTPLEMEEDDHGLRVVSKVAPTTRGRDALILYDAGVLNEHSIGFQVKARNPDDEAEITDIDLWEGSVVTWGANPLTPFLGMKGAVLSREDAMRAHIERMRKALTAPLTDETAEQMEMALSLLSHHLGAKADVSSATGAPEPPPDASRIGALFAKHLAA